MKYRNILVEEKQMALKFSKALVLPEFVMGSLNNDARLLIGFAMKYAVEVDVLAINCDIANALNIGVSKVYVLASKTATNVRAASTSIAMLLSGLSSRYDAIFVGGSSVYHVALCRASAVLNKVVVTNVIDVAEDGLFIRSAAGGRIIQRMRSIGAPPVMVSVNTSLIKVDAIQADKEVKVLQLLEFNSVSLEKFDVVSCVRRAKTGYSGCPSLSEAEVVVAGGKAFATSKLFNKYLVSFARKINAAVGATRSAVEAGIAPPECQIGQTGAIISPRIYIAFGISGASQHMAGVRGARLIISVN